MTKVKRLAVVLATAAALMAASVAPAVAAAPDPRPGVHDPNQAFQCSTSEHSVFVPASERQAYESQGYTCVVNRGGPPA